MFAKLRGKRNTPNKATADKSGSGGQGEDNNKHGFICPMCMASLPGPAELQIHFEKIHSEGGSDDQNLIDIDGDNDQTDALPESVSDDQSSKDFVRTRLEFGQDMNVPDTDKEVLLLQQELADLTAALKEEKWYTGQLKAELDNVLKERDRLEEEKVLVEEEFSSQLRSAEQGYLLVVEENKKLKDELTFADYNTTKDRHEKLRQQMIMYQNEAEEEKQRRHALEDSFQLLQSEYELKQTEVMKLEEVLQAGPSSVEVNDLQQEIKTLNETVETLKKSNQNEMDLLTSKWKTEVDGLNANIVSLNASIKELQLEKAGKCDQISTLQEALNTASFATGLSKQQTHDKDQQILQLSHSVEELKSIVKEKEDLVSKLTAEMNNSKVLLVTEVKEKENIQNELLVAKTTQEELTLQMSNHFNTIKDLEAHRVKEKEDINRLEKERIELIAKIEAGEGTDTVIQQISQEKAKLLEALTAIENSMSEQVSQHSEELNIIRQEKNKFADDLQRCQQDYTKVEKSLQEHVQKLQNLEINNDSLKEDLKNKTDEIFQLKSDSMNVQSELNTKVDEQTAAVHKYKSDLKATTEKLDKALEDLKNSNHNQVQQASWIETKNNAISEMTNKITNLHEQTVLKNSELSSATKEIESLKSKIQQMNTTSTDEKNLLNEKIKSLQSHSEKLSLDRDVAVQEKNASETKLSEVVSEKELLENMETELLQKQDEMVKQLEEVNTELKNTKQQHQEATSYFESTMLSLKTEHAHGLTEKDGELASTQKQLSDSIINLEEEIKKRNAAETEILNWETKYTKLENVLQSKDEVLSEIQSKLEIAEKELKKPCESCKNYEIQLCRLQEATKDQSGQIESLKQQIALLETSAKEHESDVLLLKEQHSTLLQDSDSKIDELKKEIEILTSEKESIEEQLMEANGAVEKLNVRIEDILKEKDGVTSTLAELEEQKNTLQNEKTNLESEIMELKIDVQTKEEEITKLNKEMEEKEGSYQTHLSKLQTQLDEKEVEITKERETHERSKENARVIQETLREESTNLKNKLDKVTSDLNVLKKSKDDLEKRMREDLAGMKIKIRKVEDDCSLKDRRIAEFEIKLKAAENEANELKGDITVMEAQLQNKNEEKKALLDRVLSSEEQHKATKQKLSETNRRLDQALSGLQELGQENQNLQVQQAIKSNRQWEKDSDVLTCKKCEKIFTMTVRKHHCRNCGLIFCKECSSFQAVVTSSKKPVRVCQPCSVELSSTRGSNVRRLSTSSIQSTQSSR